MTYDPQCIILQNIQLQFFRDHSDFDDEFYILIVAGNTSMLAFNIQKDFQPLITQCTMSQSPRFKLRCIRDAS